MNDLRILGGPPYGVFVVEDNPDDEAMTLRALQKCGLNIGVTVARDGAEAVEMLASEEGVWALHAPPCLVLLDLKLPKMGGLEVLRTMRGNPLTATIPVVCMTSSGELSDTDKAYGLGANSFVRKPIEYDQYMNVVGRTAEYWLSINFWPR